MPERTKKLLIMLLISIVILILSWMFRPFEPDENQVFEETGEEAPSLDLDSLPEI